MIELYNPKQYSSVFGGEPSLIIDDKGYIFTKDEYYRVISRTAIGKVDFQKGLIYGADHASVFADPIAKIKKKNGVTEICSYGGWESTILYIENGRIYSVEEYGRMFRDPGGYIKNDGGGQSGGGNSGGSRSGGGYSSGGGASGGGSWSGGDSGGGGGGEFAPFIILGGGLLLIVTIAAILNTAFGAKMDGIAQYAWNIHNVMRIFVVYAACPLTVGSVAALMFLKDRRCAEEPLVWVNLILALIALGAVAYIQNMVLEHYEVSISDWQCVKLYFYGYIPLMVYGIISHPMLSRCKSGVVADLLYFSASVVIGMGVAMIVLSRVTMVLVVKYWDYGAMTFFVSAQWHLLLAWLLGWKFCRDCALRLDFF